MAETERLYAELLEEVKRLRRRNDELEISLFDARRETESLRENEKSYRHLFYDAPMGIFRFTPEGKVIAANPCFFLLSSSSFYYTRWVIVRCLQIPRVEDGESYNFGNRWI